MVFAIITVVIDVKNKKIFPIISLSLSVSFLHNFHHFPQLTLFVHCFNRTPSTKKTPLGSNYSALTLKFGPLDARVTNRDHFIIPSANNSSSEILEIKEVGSIDEVRNFRTDGGMPFMMADHPYHHAVVRFEPMSYSYSQHTTTTSLSRDNSVKLRKDNGAFNSLAKKLRNCTKKAFVFGAVDGSDETKSQHVIDVVRVNTLSPSLREADEEALDSSQHAFGSNDENDMRSFYQIDTSS